MGENNTCILIVFVFVCVCVRAQNENREWSVTRVNELTPYGYRSIPRVVSTARLQSFAEKIT